MEAAGDGRGSSDKKRVTRRTRKKLVIPKEKPSMRTALYTCITTRQLKVVLELGDEFGRKAANGGCSKEAQENIDRLIGSLSKNKATRRVKPSSGLSRTRSRPRKKQLEGILTRTDEYGTTEFDFASISIGNFNINGESEGMRSVVRFSFASSIVMYEFEHSEGPTRYRVGYTYPFEDISLITFLRRTVHITLKKPAQQTLCSREPSVNGTQNSTVVGDASDDQLDVSRGQLASVLLHTIHLKRGSTKAWEEELLNANRVLFEPLIRSTLEPSEPAGAQFAQYRQGLPVMSGMQSVPPYMRRPYSFPFQDHERQQQHSTHAPAYGLGVPFGSVYGHGSALSMPRSMSREGAHSFEQGSGLLSGGSTAYPRANIYGDYFGGHAPPRALPPFDHLAADVLMSSGDRAGSARFADFSVPGFHANRSTGTGYAYRQYGDTRMDAIFGGSSGRGSFPKVERTGEMHEPTVASDMAQFGQMLHEAHSSLLDNRGDEQDKESRGEDDTQEDGEGSKRDHNDSFYWLNDLDIETLTGTGEAQSNAIRESV